MSQTQYCWRHCHCTSNHLVWINPKFLNSVFDFRAPEDGYYMFTLVIRENGDNYYAGTVMRTLASDPGNPVQLCRAEAADYGYNTGTCTVGTHAQIYVEFPGQVNVSVITIPLLDKVLSCKQWRIGVHKHHLMFKGPIQLNSNNVLVFTHFYAMAMFQFAYDSNLSPYLVMACADG